MVRRGWALLWSFVAARAVASSLLALCLLCPVVGTLSATHPVRPLDEEGERPQVLSNGRPVFEMRRQGLSSPFCTSLLQDPRGFVWVGTANGITRYDGISCRQFAVDDLTPSTDRSVRAMCFDPNSNQIWAALQRQPTLINIDQGDFTVHERALSKPRTAGDILAIASLNDSTLVARATRSFLSIDKRTGACRTLAVSASGAATTAQFLRLPPPPGAPPEERTERLVCVGNGVYHIESDGQGDTRVVRKPQFNQMVPQVARALSDSALIYMSQANDGPATFYFYHRARAERKKITTVEAIVKDFSLAPDGLWIVTNQGLLFVHYEGGRQYSFPARNNSIIDSSPNCILGLAHQPIFLIGTDEGLIMLNYYANKFLLSDIRNVSTSSTSQVTEMLRDCRGQVWLSDDAGTLLRGRTHTGFERIARTVLRRDTTGLVALDELPDSSGIALATRRNVLRMDYQAGSRSALLRDSPDSIIGLQTLRDATLGPPCVLVTLPTRLLFLAPADGRVLRSLDVPAPPMAYSHTDDGRSLFVSDTGRVVRRIDLPTGRVTEICRLDPYEGMVAQLRHINRDGVEELWLLTTRGALYYNNPPAAEVRRITKSPYLNYCARSMEIDRRGNLWVATDLGIVQLAHSYAHEFAVEDFHICRQFTTAAAARSERGDIYFGGADNFVSFRPDSLSTNSYFPAPTIIAYTSHLPSDGARISERYLLYGGRPIEMPPEQVTLRLMVGVLNYDSPDNCLYEWQLDHGEWRRRSVGEDLILDNLSAGSHTLALRSVGYSGMAQDEVTLVQIVNRVHFYQTVWFRLLVVLLSLGAAGAIVYLVYTHERRIQRRLEQEVRKQSVKLLNANEELRSRQSLIEAQNEQLEAANATLEEKVRVRTADLERERRKAVESSEFKSAFLASLGHEIRTPMNAIVGFARLLEMDTCSPADRQTFSHLILESSNSLLYIIGGLLDTSRIEKGVFDVSFNDLDVTREINDVWQILSVEKKSTGVDFMLEVDPKLEGVHISSDKDRLRQAIINLTYNAFKFTQHGHVALKALRVDPYDLRRYDYPAAAHLPDLHCDLLLIVVEDTGIGIAEDKQAEIFQPFHRLTNNTMKYAGLGLGLNIVKNIARLLGGEVWLHSELEVGSTFYFYVPISTEPPQPVEAEAKEAAS